MQPDALTGEDHIMRNKFVVFWIWMLIDCLTSTMPTNEKVLWFLVVFFLHLVGALIYYFVARPHGTHHTGRYAT